MNDDLINKQAAIDGKILIQRADGLEIFFDEAVPVKYFKSLPSAQPEPQWIPCSKRLPKEKDGKVLITLDGEVTTAIYSEFSKTWYIGDMCGVSNRVPTAWMPRPKPYRSKKNEQ